MKTNKRMMLGLALLAAAGCSPKFGLFGPQQVDLLDPARRTVAIATTNRFSSSWLAAEELTNYVAKVTGRNLRLDNRVSSLVSRLSTSTIVIGTLADLGEAAPAEARKALAATKNIEAAWTGVRDGTLWIVGKDDVAELYATYHFIEKHLGVRWFKAWLREDPGDYIPHLDTLLITEGYTEFREPRFTVRRLDMSGQAARAQPPWQGGMCAVRNGFQTFVGYGDKIPSAADKWFWQGRLYYAPRCNVRNMPFGVNGHSTFTYAVPGKVWHEKHPEYFPLVKGKRVRNAMYCVSNPDVADLLAEQTIKDYEKNGKVGWFLFGQVDREDGYCECEQCRACDAPQINPYASVNASGRFQTCVMRAAKKILAKYPDMDLRTWAYSLYRTFPPESVKLDPRVKVEYCTHGRCYGHAIDDPSCGQNLSIWNDMKKWCSKMTMCNTYEYYTCTAPYYCCREFAEAHDIKAYDAQGIRGWKNEWGFSDGDYIPPLKPNDKRPVSIRSNWQWIYLTSKLLWDPTLDPHAILDDAEEKYYGPAYPAMKKYHALRRALWEKSPRCMGYPWGDNRTVTCLDEPGSEAKLLAYLDEADKLAAEDAKSAHPFQGGRARLQTEGPIAPPDQPPIDQKRWGANYTDPATNYPSGLTILQYRIAKDRQWLNDYWIKPRHNPKNPYVAPFVRGIHPAMLLTDVTIDGKGDEPAWQGAREMTDFSDGTTATFGRDAENLYVLLKAKGELKKGDGAELWIRPPVADTNAMRVAFTWDGEGVKVEKWSGGEVEKWSGGEVEKCGLSSSPSGWTMEIKLPFAAIHAVEPGEPWLVALARVGAGGVVSSLFDAKFDDQRTYSPINFAGGGFLGGSTLTEHHPWQTKQLNGWWTGDEVVRLPCGGIACPGIYQMIDRGPLSVQGKKRAYRYRFMAQGKGKVCVARFCYDNKPCEGKPHGTGQLYKAPTDAQHPVDGAMRIYEGRVEIDPWERTIFRIGRNDKKDDITLKWVQIYPEEVK